MVFRPAALKPDDYRSLRRYHRAGRPTYIIFVCNRACPAGCLRPLLRNLKGLLRSTPQEIVDSDAVGYGSEPTDVRCKSTVCGLNGLRLTHRVGALQLKSSTAARSCSFGLVPWLALLRFAFGQKICHSIFFGPQASFKIFQKLLLRHGFMMLL